MVKTEKIASHEILGAIFLPSFKLGVTRIPFTRDDLLKQSKKLGFQVANIGAMLYAFRHGGLKVPLIRSTAPNGMSWTLAGEGNNKYAFVLTALGDVVPDTSLPVIDILDATPGMVSRYARGDEQALLAKLRYNRLIDVFTGLACYSLQSHLRTKIDEIGQVEIDEIYVGVDSTGDHYVLPVEAKGSKGVLNTAQTQGGIALCKFQFTGLKCRSIAAQYLAGNEIALFEFAESNAGIKVVKEHHYRLK